MVNRAGDWLRQAKEDLKWAKDSLSAGYYSQTCFVSQQIGEKVLKAIALNRGYVQIRSHSMLEIARLLKIDGDIEAIAMRLDQYYIASRYPDAFPSGAPFEYFTKSQVQEAFSFAERLVSFGETQIAE